ncbi:MAG: sortase domain-bontaining protein [Ilumatobacteraceae bacterium]
MTNDFDQPVSDASPTGRRDFLRGAGAAAGATLVATSVGSGTADAAATASAFVALPKPYRLADTRELLRYRFDPSDSRVINDFTRLSPNVIRVKVRDRLDIPATASAVVLNVTAVAGAVTPRYVTVYPSGVARPEASNLNIDRPGMVAGNLVFVKVGSSNSVDIYQRFQCDIVVDVIGYFVPVSGPVRAGLYRVPTNGPYRVIDTRQRGFKVPGGTSVVVDLGNTVLNNRAASALVNITAIENDGPTFYSALPYSSTGTPTTSTFNTSFAFDQRAGAAIVAVEVHGGRAKMRVYTQKSAHIIVDVQGYFTSDAGDGGYGSSDGLFVPVDPVRVLDTRVPNPAALLWPRWVVEKKLPTSVPRQMDSAVLNLTATETRSGGFLSINGARTATYTPAKTSNVNWPVGGSTVPNLTITRMAVDGFEVYSSSGGHVVADMAGYFTGNLAPAKYVKYVNPPPPVARPEWSLHIPKIGVVSRVMAGINEGESLRVTDAGHSWHWTGTGYLGETAQVAAFAHRTEAARNQTGIDPAGRLDGPYRNIHLLSIGDEWTVFTGDRRAFVYRMVRRNITSAATLDILAECRAHGGTTFSLVACSKTNFEPTSLRYRLIVTGELVRTFQV